MTLSGVAVLQLAHSHVGHVPCAGVPRTGAIVASCWYKTFPLRLEVRSEAQGSWACPTRSTATECGTLLEACSAGAA